MAVLTVNNTGLTLAGNTPAAGPAQSSFGKVTTDGTGLTAANFIVVHVGFTPKYFRWLNITDQVGIEWMEGMAADTSFKTIANGTRTLETTNQGIQIVHPTAMALAATPTVSSQSPLAIPTSAEAATDGRYVAISQNATLAAVVASKVHYWEARG